MENFKIKRLCTSCNGRLSGTTSAWKRGQLPSVMNFGVRAMKCSEGSICSGSYSFLCECYLIQCSLPRKILSLCMKMALYTVNLLQRSLEILFESLFSCALLNNETFLLYDPSVWPDLQTACNHVALIWSHMTHVDSHVWKYLIQNQEFGFEIVQHNFKISV